MGEKLYIKFNTYIAKEEHDFTINKSRAGLQNRAVHKVCKEHTKEKT